MMNQLIMKFMMMKMMIIKIFMQIKIIIKIQAIRKIREIIIKKKKRRDKRISCLKILIKVRSNRKEMNNSLSLEIIIKKWIKRKVKFLKININNNKNLAIFNRNKVFLKNLAVKLANNKILMIKNITKKSF